MKTRIISGVVAAALFIAVIVMAIKVNTLIMLALTTIIGCIGVYEALVTTKYCKSKVLAALSLIFAAIFPVVLSINEGMISKLQGFGFLYKDFVIIYAIVLFTLAMIKHETIAPTEAAFTFLITVAVPYCFWSMSALLFSNKHNGLFFFLLVFIISWGCDTGAYFSGYLFGKHKMAPKISPKKTVEGAIGGVIIATGLVFAAGLIYNKVADGTVNVPLWVIVTPVLAVISMFGDLIFSYIKRACGIKDYGKLMPGHGGVLDRFDSVSVVAPLVYMVVERITAGS